MLSRTLSSDRRLLSFAKSLFSAVYSSRQFNHASDKMATIASCFVSLQMCTLNVRTWHQCVCSLWSWNSFHVTHCVPLLVPFPLSHTSHHSHTCFVHFFFVLTAFPFFQSSSSMRRPSWSSTWSKSKSSRLTSSWKRSKRWRMKPSQSSSPWNRYAHCTKAQNFHSIPELGYPVVSSHCEMTTFHHP